jgi:hypothetical protein
MWWAICQWNYHGPRAGIGRLPEWQSHAIWRSGHDAAGKSGIGVRLRPDQPGDGTLLTLKKYSVSWTHVWLCIRNGTIELSRAYHGR